jgi:hypothetical protein
MGEGWAGRLIPEVREFLAGSDSGGGVCMAPFTCENYKWNVCPRLRKTATPAKRQKHGLADRARGVLLDSERLFTA